MHYKKVKTFIVLIFCLALGIAVAGAAGASLGGPVKALGGRKGWVKKQAQKPP